MRISIGPGLLIVATLGGCAGPLVRNWEQLDVLKGQSVDRQADLLVQILGDTPPEYHEGYREARPAVVRAALERGYLEPLRRILQRQEAQYSIFGTIALELARRGDEWTFALLMDVAPPTVSLDSEKSFNHAGLRAAAVGALSYFLLDDVSRDLVGNRLIYMLQKDPSPDVRIACTWPLATYRSPRSIEALRQASADTSQPVLPNNFRIRYSVGDAARDALGRMGVNPSNGLRP